jgi:hypothetical protein
MNRYAPLAEKARRRGRPLILSEVGSAACGGLSGVSDTFAGALWGLDWLLRSQFVGIKGVYFQMAGPYSPFNITSGVGQPPAAEVLPLYYGMLMFKEAVAGRPRAIFARQNLRLYFRNRGPNVPIWALRARGGAVRVLVLNKDLRKAGRVRIRVRGARRRASLVRLSAPSLRSRSEVTLAGQTFGSRTTDGVMTGTRREERVRRRKGGVYVFRVPTASAALLKIPPG